MNYKIQRFGIVLFLLSALVVIGIDTGILIFIGLAGCAIAVGLLIEDKFFKEEE